MKIACLGGGPAGLYFAISMKLRDAAHDITVFERNRPDDTFGWGVVFSDETFDNITANDPVSAAAIRAHFAYWDDIAVHYRGQRIVSSGHGFSGIARKKLLMLLQAARQRAWRDAGFSDRDRQRRRTRRKLRSRRRGGRTEFQDARRIRALFPSPPSTRARTNSFGSAPIRNSMTPSLSSSNRPSTAGSGRTPTSSTPTPRRSSSNAPKRPGRNSASAR